MVVLVQVPNSRPVYFSVSYQVSTTNVHFLSFKRKVITNEQLQYSWTRTKSMKNILYKYNIICDKARMPV